MAALLSFGFASYADCGNVHCTFEYLGCSGLHSPTREMFLERPLVNAASERLFATERIPFREMNWRLFCLERAIECQDHWNVENLVDHVATLLRNYSNLLYAAHSHGPRTLILRWRMDLLEKIEYSLARMILGVNRRTIFPFVEKLLPDTILNESYGIRSWHSILTFKRMLILSYYIQEYALKESTPPLRLDMVGAPERYRKCACGKDIEYEQHKQTWMLRSRCESHDGGLGFNEYLPMIYHQRKALTLCLSPSFNAMRQTLFNGRNLSESDLRIKGHIVHDVAKDGVHGMQFDNISVGATRMVSVSETQEE